MDFRQMSNRTARWPALPAYVALPAGALTLLCVGACAAALHGRMSGEAVAVTCGALVCGLASVSEANAALPLGVVAWMTASAFGRRRTVSFSRRGGRRRWQPS